MSPRLVVTLSLALLPGCSDRPLDGDTDGPATSTAVAATSTGSEPQPTTSTATTAATGPEPTTGDPSATSTSTSAASVSTGESTTAAPLDAGQGECDIWAQDCPDGQKCVPVSVDGEPGLEVAQCRLLVVEPDPIDAPCTVIGESGDGLDSCAEGLVCWQIDLAVESGVCVALCIGSPDSPSCPDANVACSLDPLGVANLCLRSCDPLAHDCPADNLCVPFAGDFVCVDDASGDQGQLFGGCSRINTCDEGLFCDDSFEVDECDGAFERCCVPYCDITVEPDPCPGQGQQCSAFTDVPPGLEHVGTCIVPPI